MDRTEITLQNKGFFATGGWVLLVALLAVAAVFLWSISRWLRTQERAVGDGTSVATYGFPLEPCLVSRHTLVASGMPKDGLKAITAPRIWTVAQLRSLTGRRYRKLLLASDPVAGVVLAGESRAYPLRFLTWHEVVNDTLAGTPVAVTYHPISGGVVVFDRRVAGETVELAVSGLLLDSSQLLYDRQSHASAESLWSQLQMRAIAGPAAARHRTLRPLPVTVAPWAWWLAQHPDTTLLAPVERLLPDYRRNPYGSYFGSDLLRYPVALLPPTAELPLKTPIVAVALGDRFHAFTLPFVTGSSEHGSRTLRIAGLDLRFHWQGRPTAMWLEQPSARLPVARSLLFAWYAAHHTDTVWHGLPTVRESGDQPTNL